MDKIDEMNHIRYCPNHRPILKSSEIVFADRFEYGEPIGNKCVFICLSCIWSKEYLFKDRN